MRIHMWIKKHQLEKMTNFLSNDFEYDNEIKLVKFWYSNPSGISNDYVQISITIDQYTKLMDVS